MNPPDDVMAARLEERPRHRNLQAYVLDELGLRVVSGAVAVGHALPNETDLATELGVSKTVIREAIRGLAAKGLVNARPKLGTRVCDSALWHTLDPSVLSWQAASQVEGDFLQDLDELRYAIEPMNARLAALRSEVADREALLKAVELMEKHADRDEEFFRADIDFHGAMLKATHNALIGGLQEAVTTALKIRHSASDHALGNAESVGYHRTVAEAVLAGDADRAQRAMYDLLHVSAHNEGASAFLDPSRLAR